MKVTFPKNIKKWFFSGFTIPVWPISVSVLQLVMVAVWIWLGVAAFNAANNAWSKGLWIVLAIIILVLFIFVAFFKVSEMNVIQLVAKMVKENFFDVTKKYQTNAEKLDPIEIALKEWEIKENKQQVIEQKWEPNVDEIMEEIKNDELV